MKKWTFYITWKVRREMKRRAFKSREDALAFAESLMKHGIQPMMERQRPVTLLDRIMLFFGRGELVRHATRR